MNFEENFEIHLQNMVTRGSKDFENFPLNTFFPNATFPTLSRGPNPFTF